MFSFPNFGIPTFRQLPVPSTVVRQLYIDWLSEHCFPLPVTAAASYHPFRVALYFVSSVSVVSTVVAVCVIPVVFSSVSLVCCFVFDFC